MAIAEGQKIEIKWNGANKKRYIDLGYSFTSIGDSFNVDIEHLSKGSKSIVKAFCDWCGEGFEREMNLLNRKDHKHHFCSNKCQHDFRSDFSEKNKPIKTCERCGDDYKTEKHNFETSRFCSAKCLSDWQSTAFKGEKSPVFVERIEVNCEWCDSTLYRTPNKLSNRNYNFCNNNCRNTWHREVYVKSDEFKLLMSNVALNNLAQGKYKFTDTAPHKVIKNLLDYLKIKYTCEYILGQFSFDIHLTDYNLFIEINGGYWHCDPRLYDQINYIQQLNRIIQDKKKRTFAKNNNGKILYLWELDINNEIEVCKEIILRYILNNGKLKEYNSFNYFIDDNNDLMLDGNKIKAYIDISENNLMNKVDLSVRQIRTGYDPSKNITFNCDNCGKKKTQNLKYYLKSENHFCSVLCKNLFQQIGNESDNLKHEYPCDNCQKMLQVRNYVYQEFLQGKRKCITCSRKCQGEWVGKNKPRQRFIVKCLWCGKEDKILQNRVSKYKYCSKDCQVNASKNKIDYNCEQCGKTSKKTPSQYNKSKNHFCSPRCANEFRRKL